MMHRRLILGLSFLSGVAALGYEVLWSRRLGDILGHSVYAISIVIVAFFAGMALGSLWASSWLKNRDVRRSYIQLELTLAVFGLVSPWLFSLLSSLYYALVPDPASTWANLSVRCLVALLILSLPCLCMGATLPVLVRAGYILARSEALGDPDAAAPFDVARWTARLYLWNTSGAALGAGLAGTLLLRALGLHGGIVVVALCNFLVVALAAYGLPSLQPLAETQTKTSADQSVSSGGTSEELVSKRQSARAKQDALETAQVGRGRWFWLTAFAIVGFCSIAYELLWTRALVSVLGNSVYSFSALLSIYLLGLALGGGLYAWCKTRRALRFGSLQILVGVCGVASIWLIPWLPQWQRQLHRAWQGQGLWVLASEWLLIATLLLLPCVLMGAALPAMVALIEEESGQGLRVGWVLGANTLGGALAPIVVGLWLLPWLHLAMALAVIAALQLLLGLMAHAQTRDASIWPGGLALGGLLLVLLTPQQVGVWRWSKRDHTLLHFREGIAASLAVVKDKSGRRRLKLNNRFSMGGETGRFGECRQGMLPVLFHPSPRLVLALGVGSGNTVGASVYASQARTDAVELVPGVISLLPYFAKSNGSFWKRSDVRLVAGDARHFVAATDARYDVVIGDLFHSYKAGVGSLHTREHYRRIRGLLEKQGLYLQWLPLYQLSPEMLKLVVRTFVDVFPHSFASLAYLNAKTPVLGLLGFRDAPKLSYKALAQRIRRHPKRSRLRQCALGRPSQTVAMLIADAPQLRRFAGPGMLHRERYPWMELQAPLERWSRAWSSFKTQNLRAVLAWTPPYTKLFRDLSSSTLGQLQRRHASMRAYLQSRLMLSAPQQGQDPSKAVERLLIQSMLADPSWRFPHLIAERRLERYRQKKSWAAATRFLRAWTKALPKDDQAWFLWGTVAFRQGRLKSATRFFREALHLRPGFTSARRNLVLLLLRERRVVEAAALLRKAQSARLRGAHGLWLRTVQGLLRANQFRVAWPLILHLSRQQSIPPKFWTMAGFVALRLKRRKRAILFLRKALGAGASRDIVVLWLAQALWREHRPAESQSVVERGLRRFPRSQRLRRFQLFLQRTPWPMTPPESLGVAKRPTSRPASKPRQLSTSQPASKSQK